MVKKDFITSIVLIVFSLSIIVMSYTMDRLEHRSIDPFSAPGVVPGMIGSILLCLALILFFRSISRGGYRFFSTAGKEQTFDPGAVKRVMLTLVLSLIYAVGLLGRIDYTLATGLYVFSFIVLFEYRSELPLRSKQRVFFYALLQALITAVLITLVFRKLFLVDLP